MGRPVSRPCFAIWNNYVISTTISCGSRRLQRQTPSRLTTFSLSIRITALGGILFSEFVILSWHFPFAAIPCFGFHFLLQQALPFSDLFPCMKTGGSGHTGLSLCMQLPRWMFLYALCLSCLALMLSRADVPRGFSFRMSLRI